ncbi:DUF5658 family protein [Thermococcus gammatolerans]|uniref:DUF5658 domain-containing protein n=1 Tax=Thermococcus gammatolerans (strain DSM 15229 / JCM 11827 / EJ3) TaxID=593117 RepID=C5A608_THEGJ|nr:DUF5658 family protein [Thermococcus gammatolerans]ACS33670.1 Conserved hypothetical protein [Thermococcus gammatolerans EJ3]
MKARTYLLLFILLALVDALTTWFGVRMGFVEANGVIAERLGSPTLFFGSYAFFTALGAGVIAVSIKLEKLNPAFKLVAVGMVVLKAIPAVNNVLLLAGISKSSVFLTTVEPLLKLASG